MNYQIIPITDTPAQRVNITLSGQSCRIDLYSKSINAPISPPGMISTDPPVYENSNPVFLDLYINDTLILGGALCLNGTRIVRNVYLGFTGDLAIIDISGKREDPFGVSRLLPPIELRNWWQRHIPLSLGGKSPELLAGKIPDLGTRWLLTYWPDL